MNRLVYFLFVSSLIFYFTEKNYACTTFCLKQGDMIVYGRNYDFNLNNSDGFIIINKRNVAKAAFIPPTENPARWVSKYGSVTFNQMAREFPMGGMNEKGLVIAQMWHSETRYPEADNRPAVGALQWMQYQLDNYTSVQEVISSDSVIRIPNIMNIRLHYLACDSYGNTATIEFIDGKLVYHTNADSLFFPLLSNYSYDETINFLKKPVLFSNSIDEDRMFAETLLTIAAYKIKAYDKGYYKKPIIESAFDVLSSVTVKGHTSWSVVYDIKKLMIHFKSFKNSKIRVLNLKDFTFECNTPVKILDIQQGVVSNFSDYSTEINREYLFKAIDAYISSGIFSKDTLKEPFELLAKFPEFFNCVQ